MTNTAGCLFVISAPSGTGKTSLVRALLQSDLNLNLSISHTTRPPRSEEVNGRDYHFVSKDTFQQMLVSGEFLESAEVYGNLYGTSQRWVNEVIASGQDILLEIDCQGARQIQRIFPQSVGIFILPPSVNSLAIRLKTRAQDNPEIIQKRLAAAREEVSHIAEFDYIVINNELDEALRDLICIIKAERLKKEHQVIKHHALIAQLT
ncbi:guanylate kinase [Nitrosomonas sp. Nm166]|uniref:guanylate kinase n=1 Tax=Nitrosomonas sp. Nm166 TaxID=1881054 RepID=UPI0008DECC85|nr:guanylate kinase [Nitrosomonas sp. Nm166]SFE67090.1 guanylate kinase [Nitrosomonas sp. Nm166]